MLRNRQHTEKAQNGFLPAPEAALILAAPEPAPILTAPEAAP